MTSQHLKNWPVLNFLKPLSPLDISMVFVFGSGKEALITTKDLKVYGLGANQSGCLGIGTHQSVTRPTEIVQLSGYSVKTFASGPSPCVLALTDDGTVYTWGCNNNGQLGTTNGSTSYSPMLCEELKRAGFIKDIACSLLRSVALTDKGKVFMTTKTNTQYGAWCTVATQFVVKYISSQRDADSFITKNNKLLVYRSAQDIKEYQCSCLIEKVVSGRNHSLALTSTMDVLSWGDNSCGQLGRQNSSSKLAETPHKVEFPVPARILDIAASNYTNISIALDVNNRVFIWGSCCNQNIDLPMIIHLSNLHDAIAIFGGAVCMHAPLRICAAEDNTDMNLLESIKLSFDDPDSCDLIIEVEGKDINVHANILKMRSPYFQTMLKEPWTKCGERVKVDGYSYGTYWNLLWYLHSDDCAVTTTLEAVLLYEAADIHLLPVLKYRCALIFKSQLDVPTALLVFTIVSEKNLTELVEVCLKFMLCNLTAVVHAPGFNELPEDCVKQLMIQAATGNLLKT